MEMDCFHGNGPLPSFPWQQDSVVPSLTLVSMTTGLCIGPTEHAQFISQCTQQGWCQGAHFPITGAVHSCFRLQSYSNQCMLYLKSPILINPALWCCTLIFHTSTTLYSTQREKGSGHMTIMLLTWQNVTNLSHYALLLISTSLIGIMFFICTGVIISGGGGGGMLSTGIHQPHRKALRSIIQTHVSQGSYWAPGWCETV